MKKPAKQADIIAFRRKCKGEGTGLSHYILMDKKAK
ncbi:MAG: modified peptide precursor CbpA [Planctomycetota bacterium]